LNDTAAPNNYMNVNTLSESSKVSMESFTEMSMIKAKKNQVYFDLKKEKTSDAKAIDEIPVDFSCKTKQNDDKSSCSDGQMEKGLFFQDPTGFEPLITPTSIIGKHEDNVFTTN